MLPSLPINPSRTHVDEKKRIPGTDLIIHRYAILSTSDVTYQISRPFVYPKDRIGSPYSSYTIIDGVYWGDITAADLPPEIDVLPVGPERIAAVKGYHEALERLALSYAQLMYPDDFMLSPYLFYPTLTEWLYGRLEQSWNREMASIATKRREQGEEELSLQRLKELAAAALAVHLVDEEMHLERDVRDRLADCFVKHPDVYTDKFIQFHNRIMEIETPYRATLQDLSGSRTLIEDEREYRKILQNIEVL